MAKRILVVDDHDVVRQGVRLILRSRPEWTVVDEASNGVEAVEKIKTQKPDLVVLDISMPEKDGLEVIRDVKALGSASKILVLSMHNAKELVTRVRDLGASGYIVKTNAARDLIRAIDDIFSDGMFFPDIAAKPAPDSPSGASGKKNTSFCLDLLGSAAFAF
jgi:DNA-binding NarL/FixJ family response regulator